MHSRSRFRLRFRQTLPPLTIAQATRMRETSFGILRATGGPCSAAVRRCISTRGKPEATAWGTPVKLVGVSGALLYNNSWGVGLSHGGVSVDIYRADKWPVTWPLDNSNDVLHIVWQAGYGSESKYIFYSRCTDLAQYNDRCLLEWDIPKLGDIEKLCRRRSRIPQQQLLQVRTGPHLQCQQ